MKKLIIILVAMVSIFAVSNASAQTSKKEKKHTSCFFYKPNKVYYENGVINKTMIDKDIAEYKAGNRTHASIFQTENCEGWTIAAKAGYAIGEGMTGGLAVAYRFAHVLRGEVEVNYGQINFEEQNYGAFNAGINLYVDMLKHKTNGKISPYFGIGAGYTHFKSFVDIDMDTKVKRYKVQSNALTLKALAGVNFRVAYNLQLGVGAEYSTFEVIKTDISSDVTTSIRKNLITPAVKLTYIF